MGFYGLLGQSREYVMVTTVIITTVKEKLIGLGFDTNSIIHDSKAFNSIRFNSVQYQLF